MAVRILFDHNHIPQEPTLVLANRDGNKLGVIPALHINVGDHLNDAMELQFVVQKELNGTVCPLWDEIVDFKLAWCPEWDAWFEIHVEAKDSESVFKNINAVALGHAELSQINLYNIEINTETDIANDDYVVTVLYNEDNPKASLLNRISEKIPHYSIGHVDDSIAGIQRTFSFDGTTILDALNTIAEEIDCLFVIDNGSDENGKPARTINAYDLEAVCRSCGYRGVFTGKCPECYSDDVAYGYGEDTNIYVSSENLSDEITYTSNVDQVKNCFRLVGGDDLMTAAIASCNPNGSGYMWYFSEAMKEDMSEELRSKLAEYDAEYANYVNEREFSLPASLVSRYNTLINKYKVYRDTLETISNPVKGYSKLMNVYYDAIDFEMLLRNELMPSIEIAERTAQTEVTKLTSAALSPTAVTSLEICSLATATSAVQSVAKQLVDGNFQVRAEGVSFDKPTWRGTITVTNYSDDEDTASTGTVSVTITDDQEAYLSQRINKILSDGDSDIVDISNLFKADLSRFKNELKKYCLAQLNSMRDICQSCLDILIENGTAKDDGWPDEEANPYQQLYLPYYNKLNALIAEVALREEELAIIAGTFDENGGVVTEGIETAIQDVGLSVQEHLDFEAFLGAELTKQLAAYRRDDTYQNDNFISDGLNNAELIVRAQEFIELAKKEIYKSATLQHTIISSLKNLLVMREFSDLTEQFAVGNWLSVGVDGKVYRLRLTSYEIDFDDLENINVEFSDVVETLGGVNDLESIIKSAASMSTTFGSVKRQANRGGRANMTLTEYMEKGLALTNMKIVTSANNQSVTMDEHGILLREKVPYNEEYDERQAKFINRGLYLTDDGWRTSRAGIGDFYYYDPKDGQIKQKYGLVADMLIAPLVLSEEVGIYNTNNTITIDKNGLHIITTHSDEDGAENTAFRLSKQVGDDIIDVIWFDNDGNANFRGDVSMLSTMGDRTVGDLLDQVDATITNVDVEYAKSQSATTAPENGWQTDAPEWEEGWYIWQRTATTTPSGTTYSDPVCISGRDGAAVDIDSIEYAEGDNGTTAPSTGWQSTVPEVDQGNWLWVRTVYSNGAVVLNCSYIGTDGKDGKSVAIQSITKSGTTTTVTFLDSDGTTQFMTIEDGEDGPNGTPGANGYVHIAWANSADGSADFSTTVSAGKSYLGAYTDDVEADSNDPSDYSWSLIKGVGISSVTEYYALNNSTSAPADSSFSTGVKTPTSSNRYVWNYELISYTDGSSAKTSKHIVATYAEDGKGISSIVEYYAINNSTTAPAKNSFSTTPQAPTSENKYLWNYEVITYSDGGTSETDRHIVGAHGDKGVGISSVTEYYALNNSTTAPADSSFSTGVKTPTSDNKYVWNYELITYTDSTTKKTDKHIAAMYGAEGAAGKGISSITDYYAINNSTTAPADSSFSTNIQTPTSANKYLWNYEYISYTDGSHTSTGKRVIGMYGEKGDTGDQGNAGIGVSAIEEQYYLSTNSSSCTGGSWSTTQPEWASGKYIWTRSKVTWTNNTTTYTTAVLAKAINGANKSAADAQSSVTALDNSLNQTAIFNRLTNYGAAQGMVLSNGQLYINATYIQSGTLKLGGSNNANGTLNIYASGATTPFATLDNAGAQFRHSDYTGLQIGPYGDLAISVKLTDTQLSSFYDNKCSFQINNQGDVKVGRELGVWGRPNDSSNYVKVGEFRSDYVSSKYRLRINKFYDNGSGNTSGLLITDGEVAIVGANINLQGYSISNGSWAGNTIGVSYGGTGQTSIANIQAGKDGDGNTISSTYIKVTPTDVGSCSTLSALNTALQTVYNTMSDHTVRKIHFLMSTAVGVFHAAHYIGEISRLASNTATVVVGDAYGSKVFGYTTSVSSGFTWSPENPLTLGSTSYSTVIDAVTAIWNSVPDDSMPHMIRLNAQYGYRFGFIARNGNYGVGHILRHDGTDESFYVNNGTVTMKSNIRAMTVTGTTSAYGNINFNLSASRYWVLAAYSTTDGQAVQPLVYSGSWRGRVTNATSTAGAAVANTSVTIRVAYVDYTSISF